MDSWITPILVVLIQSLQLHIARAVFGIISSLFWELIMTYFLNDITEASFFLGFGKKTKPPAKQLRYKDLSESTKKHNAKWLYKNQFGGDYAAKDIAKNKNNPLNYKQAKQYVMDVARQFDEDTLEGRDTNSGLNRINKKYKF
jgi:hypothetical protein